MKGAASVLLAAALVAIACSSRRGSADPSSAAPSAASSAASSAAPPTVSQASAAPAPLAGVDDLKPVPPDDRSDGGTVTIKLLADPRRQAHVYWGRRDLGVAPLEIVRPRGSGPLDLTIQAPECLPLHTRAFTDRDDTLSLRLYTAREASGLPGYSPTATSPPTPTPTRTPR